MGEHREDTPEVSLLQEGVGGGQGSSVRPSVVEALDGDLDAYLDRELFTRPSESVFSPRASERAAPPEPEVKAEAGTVLELAAQEEAWLRELPPPAVKEEAPPAPAPRVEVAPPFAPLPPVAPPPVQTWGASPVAAPPGLPGLQPHHRWATAYTTAPAQPRRWAWLVAGALGALLIAGALAWGLLWGRQPPAAEASVAAPAPVRAAPVPPAHMTVSLESVSPASAPAGTPSAAPAPVAAPPVVALPTASSAEAPPVEATPPAPPATPPAAPRAVAPSEARPAAPRASPEPKPAAPPLQESRARTEPREVLAASAVAPKKPARAPLSADSSFEPVAVKLPAPAPAKASGYEEFDDAFAREMGFTDKPATPVRPDPRASRSVWIPPAPGESVPEHLTAEDIQRVVLSHKDAVAGCVQQHRASAKPDTASGRLVARWSVLPDGATAGVTVETAEFRGTPLARCLEGLIQTWRFPAHQRVQQEPIRFPFTF